VSRFIKKTADAIYPSHSNRQRTPCFVAKTLCVAKTILTHKIVPRMLPPRKSNALSIRPTQDISKIVLWLKCISSRILLSEFAHLRKQFGGSRLWAQGYLAISSGNIMGEMIQQYIQEHEGGRWLITVDFKATSFKPLFL